MNTKHYLHLLLLVLYLAACSLKDIKPDVPIERREITITGQIASPSATEQVIQSSSTISPLPVFSPTARSFATMTPNRTATFLQNSTATEIYKDLKRVHYNEKTWTHFGDQSGLLYSDITSIAVSPDQTVWFGGSKGYLLHFDGTSIISYTLPIIDMDNFYRLSDTQVSHDRTVWVSTDGSGIYQFDGKNWIHFTKKQGLTERNIDRLLISPDNTIWALVRNPSIIFRFNGIQWEKFWSYDQQINIYGIYDIAITNDGTLWAATNTLARLNGVEWYQFPPDTFDNTGECGIVRVEAAPDGTFWLTDCISPELIHFSPEKPPEVYRIPELNYWDIGEGVIYVSPNNTVWVGPDSCGSVGNKNILLHWNGQRWTIYDQLPFNDYLFACFSIHAITQTTDGIVWVATTMGIYRFKPEE